MIVWNNKHNSYNALNPNKIQKYSYLNIEKRIMAHIQIEIATLFAFSLRLNH